MHNDQSKRPVLPGTQVGASHSFAATVTPDADHLFTKCSNSLPNIYADSLGWRLNPFLRSTAVIPNLGA